MKQEEHASHMWIILVAAAMNRQTMNYVDLGKKLGIPAQGLALILGHVLWYCERKGLPPLTALVVKKDGGVPGNGFGDQSNLDRERERIYLFKWYTHPAPRADDLLKTLPEGYRKRQGE